MRRLRNALGALVVPLFFALVLALPVHALEAASCGGFADGEVLVPTPVPQNQKPPLLSPLVAHTTKAAAHVVHPFPAGAAYTLRADNPPSLLCVASSCLFVPDFNVVWYTAGGTALMHDSTQGDTNKDDKKKIPTGADFAYVYMRFGPNADTTDGQGASFLLEWDCA